MLMNVLPSLNEVFSMMVEQEQQLKAPPSVPAVESMACLAQGAAPSNLVASGSRPRFPTRFFAPAGGQSYGHYKPRPVCTHYGILEHTYDRHFERIGNPPGYKTKLRPSAHSVGSEAPVAPILVNWETIQNTYQQMVQYMTKHSQATPSSSAAQACSITTVVRSIASTSGHPISDDDWFS